MHDSSSHISYKKNSPRSSCWNIALEYDRFLLHSTIQKKQHLNPSNKFILKIKFLLFNIHKNVKNFFQMDNI